MADQAATAFSGAAHLAETRRLAAELRQLLDMSSALSRSLDPKDVAVLMAEHLARAVGAEQAQISDWDRPNDRLRTLGCYPAELRPDIADFYPLAGYPVTRRVLGDGAIAVVDAEDPEADPAEAALLRAEGMRGLMMLPLIAKGEAIGLVELTSCSRPTSDPGQITLARTMAHEAAMALENARLYETARNLADRDPLTGFFNHRYLHERLSRGDRPRRPEPAAAERGHAGPRRLQAGQRHLRPRLRGPVLVHVAELVRSTLRASDVAARYGGDEFALILPETGRDEAARVAERILDAFRASPFAAEGRGPDPHRRVDRHRDAPVRRADRHGPDRDRGPRPVRRQGCGRGARLPGDPRSRPPGRGRHAAAVPPVAPAPDAAGRRAGGDRSGEVRTGLTRYGSTGTRPPSVPGAGLVAARSGPHPVAQGEDPGKRAGQGRASRGPAGPRSATPRARPRRPRRPRRRRGGPARRGPPSHRRPRAGPRRRRAGIGIAVVRERDEAAGPEGARRTEAESFARILRGLARSVSPDAIVDAIVEELGTGTGRRSRGGRAPAARDAQPRGDPLLAPRRGARVADVPAAQRARGPGRGCGDRRASRSRRRAAAG